MIRIAISVEAFEAIAATLPLGSVGYENKTDEHGLPLTRASPCEACSAFTRVAARTLARSPIRDQLHRRLQPFRHLHDCSGCFRLERLPGGPRTHWKAPPCHGAHVNRSLRQLDLGPMAAASHAERQRASYQRAGTRRV
jgi:hypothetical protein